MRQIGRRLAATAACVVFVLLFAFAQFVGIGNYNYVCPYAHEMTHGLMLSLAGAGGGMAAWSGVKLRLGTLSGLALGLAFLTKAEVFLAGAAATGAALLLGLLFERPGWRRGLRGWPVFRRLSDSAGRRVLLPGLCHARATGLARHAGSWVVAARSDCATCRSTAMGRGWINLRNNIGAMLSMTGLYAIVLVPAGIMGLLLRRRGPISDVDRRRGFCVTVAWFGVARADRLGRLRPDLCRC